MEISSKQLRSLLRSAYECGYHGVLDNAAATVEEMVAALGNQDDDYRIWSVEELTRMGEGTLFHHVSMGRCWIVAAINGNVMRFSSGEVWCLRSNRDPWDQPMKLLSLP